MSRIFLIACEASGDKHGAELVRSIKKIDPTINFSGLGGSEMARAGVNLLEDMTRISVLGFGDVLKKYFQFRRIFYRALGWVQEWRPDLLILIDSPAFNLRLAKKIRRQFPVVYYISPQIWAWGWRRIHTIRKVVDHMMVILPFEEEIYQREKIPCTFVGHPLLDQVKPSQPRTQLRSEFGLEPREKMIALLPGSREPEVRRILPIMLETARILQRGVAAPSPPPSPPLPPEADPPPVEGEREKGEGKLKFFLVQAPYVSDSLYDENLKNFPELSMIRTTDRLYDTVHAADFALVASGTATLETALLGTPFFLLYKASASTFFLGRRLVRIPYIGLVNVLAGRPVVPEFIQHLAQPEKIAHETKILLENDSLREKFKAGIRQVCQKLGEPGASDRAARVITDQFLRNPSRPSESAKV